jgi:hypothetical protein
MVGPEGDVTLDDDVSAYRLPFLPGFGDCCSTTPNHHHHQHHGDSSREYHV